MPPRSIDNVVVRVQLPAEVGPVLAALAAMAQPGDRLGVVNGSVVLYRPPATLGLFDPPEPA